MSQLVKTSWGPCIFILLFIFSPVLSTQETAQPGALYVISIVVPMFFMAVSKRLIKSNIINLYAVLLLLFAIISTGVSDLGSFRIGSFMKYFFLIVFFICSNSIALTDKQLKFSFLSYFWLCIAISLLIILSYIFGYPHTASDYYLGRYSIGITGIYKNPNYLTSFYNVAFFVICYILAFVKLTVKKKYMMLFALLMFIISSYFTGTRAALLIELLSICSIAFLLAKNRHLNKIIPIAIIVVVVIIKYSSELDLMLSFYLGDRDAFADVGRSEAWAVAMDHIINSPLLGCGHNSWYNIHGATYLEWLHNIFLELTLDQGLIGFFLFIGIVSTGFSGTKSYDRYFLLLFFIIYTIPMSVQNGLYEVHFWRYIIINRLLVNYSTYNEGGITSFLERAFGSTQSSYSLRDR